MEQTPSEKQKQSNREWLLVLIGIVIAILAIVFCNCDDANNRKYKGVSEIPENTFRAVRCSKCQYLFEVDIAKTKAFQIICPSCKKCWVDIPRH